MNVKVSFYLKEPNAIKETMLYCFVYVTRKDTFKISHRIKLHPNDWNHAKQTVKKTNSNCNELNDLLKKIKGDYESLCLKASLQNLPITKAYLTNNSTTKNKVETESLLFMAYDEFIKSKNTSCTKRTIQKYLLIKKYLKRFAISQNFDLNFNTVDLVFYEKFCQYLLFELKMFNNSVSKTIKFVKTFLNYAVDRGYTENLAFKKFKELKDNSNEIIALSESELLKIVMLKSLPDYLENCRDLFLLLCYTSLRFSDLETINGSQINNNIISYTVKKTKEQQQIFLNDTIKTVLDKYTVKNIVKLRLISNVNCNKYLKEIGQLAELNEPIKKTRIRGGEAITKDLQKWQLLTTHTGRRTFTTLSLYKGINPELVKKITGHKTDREFKKYQKFNDEQLKASMKVWDKI